MDFRRAVAAASVALLLAATGCESREERVNELFSTMMQLPDIETMESKYQGLLATIRERLVAEIGIRPWQQSGQMVSGSGCGGDLSALRGDGEIRRYRSGKSPGNIADADWPRALRLVASIAQEQGFGGPATVVDRAGDHEVSLKDQYGAELLFGTAVNTTLSLSTGCHLTREARDRGTSSANEPLY